MSSTLFRLSHVGSVSGFPELECSTELPVPLAEVTSDNCSQKRPET